MKNMFETENLKKILSDEQYVNYRHRIELEEELEQKFDRSIMEIDLKLDALEEKGIFPQKEMA